MAIVMYKRNKVDAPAIDIPRCTSTSLPDSAAFEDVNVVQCYNKPHVRPEPPPVPASISFHGDRTLAVYNDAVSRDITWLLARFIDEDGKVVPSWKIFNAIIHESIEPLTTIIYLPFIHACPTDMSTIYTYMLQVVNIVNKLKQGHVFIKADLSIYSKAQEILWNKPPLLDGKVTMRLGAMHLTMALLASIGMLYADGGLSVCLTQSGVYADASCSLMMQGKQLARGIRAMTLSLEAFSILFFHALQKCDITELMDNHDEHKELNAKLRDHNYEAARNYMDELCDTYTGSNMHSVVEAFVEEGMNRSKTFQYWWNFMQYVLILLRVLRADKTANFELHLNAASECLPLLRIAGRNNYTKFLPVYLANNKRLEAEHPDAYHHLQISRSTNTIFNCVATDQNLEQSINREAKSHGGLSLRKQALTRWLVTRHLSGDYAMLVKEMCQSVEPKEEVVKGTAQQARDVNDVQKIHDLISDKWQNPFDLDTVPSALVNISTGMVATEEVANSLLGVDTKGQHDVDDFIQNRLKEDSRKDSFCKTVPRVKTKTKRLTVDIEVMFRRLLIVSKERNVNLKDMPKHELAAVPPSLFNEDGTIRKTPKAKKVEAAGTLDFSLPHTTENETTAYIIDGMALLHSLNENHFKNVDELADLVMRKMVTALEGNMQVKTYTIVFDRYFEDSINDSERTIVEGLQLATHVVSGQRDVPNYKIFLLNTNNKMTLVNHISVCIERNIQDHIPQGQRVVLAGGYEYGQLVRCITPDSIEDGDHLFSTQEEADTIILLHAIDANGRHSRIIVKCDDTDVLVLLMYYTALNMITISIYMQAGHIGMVTNRLRFIPIHDIVLKLGNSVVRCLSVVHSLTGCDSTNAMFRIGKRTAYNVLQKQIQSVEQLSSLGATPLCTEEHVAVATNYAKALYGNKKTDGGGICTSLDELWYVVASSSDKSASELPLTDDAYRQYIQRCVYQLFIWTPSQFAKPVLPSPIDHGWVKDEDVLKPVPFTKDPAPVEVRSLTHLFCSDKKCERIRSCQCIRAGLQCTEYNALNTANVMRSVQKKSQ